MRDDFILIFLDCCALIRVSVNLFYMTPFGYDLITEYKRYALLVTSANADCVMTSLFFFSLDAISAPRVTANTSRLTSSARRCA